MKFSTSSIVLAAGLLLQTAQAISPIVAKGAKFFSSDGNQFYVKGIAYQLTSDDPLVDGAQCQRDIALMKTLGTNAIRVYHVDPSQDHDACMNAFADAGIYVFLDVDTFSTYIIGITPAWTSSQFNSYAAVVDAFHGYDNVAGFYVGNEVLTYPAESISAPYIKAAVRDLKAYTAQKGYRAIPFGYSAADIASLRPNLQNYLACGDDPIDFFSLNAYEWCGDSSYTVSGYDQLQAMTANYSIPIFFSETGCITVRPRLFNDQAAILGPDMDGTWSGAIIYEWIEEANDYGIISYGPPASTGLNVVDGFTRGGTPTPVQPDFSNLANQWATLTPTGVQMNAYTPSLSAPACPSFTAGSWLLSGNVPLPTLGQSYIGAAVSAQPTGSSSGSGSLSPATSSSSGSGSGSSSGSSSAGSAATSSPSHAAASSLGRAPMTGDLSSVLVGFVGFAAFVFTAVVVL